MVESFLAIGCAPVDIQYWRMLKLTPTDVEIFQCGKCRGWTLEVETAKVQVRDRKALEPSASVAGPGPAPPCSFRLRLDMLDSLNPDPCC